MMSDEMPVFGIYEKAVRPQSFEDMFRDARKAGYQSFELSIDASNGRLKRLFWGKKEAAEVWQAALRQDMKILTMCLSGHKRFPLGSSDPEITSAGMKIMEKALELGGRLGIRIIQLSGLDGRDQKTLRGQRLPGVPDGGTGMRDAGHRAGGGEPPGGQRYDGGGAQD